METLNLKSTVSLLLTPWSWIIPWPILGLGVHTCTLWDNSRTQDVQMVFLTQMRISKKWPESKSDITGIVLESPGIMNCQRSRTSFASFTLRVSLIWRVWLVWWWRKHRLYGFQYLWTFLLGLSYRFLTTPLLSPSLVLFPPCSAKVAHTECIFESFIDFITHHIWLSGMSGLVTNPKSFF